MKQAGTMNGTMVVFCALWSLGFPAQDGQNQQWRAHALMTPLTDRFFRPSPLAGSLRPLRRGARAAGQDVFFFITQFGSEVTAPGELNNPSGIAIDGAGDVYVADTENDRVQKFDSKGKFILQFGGTGDAPGQFFSPQGIAVDRMGNVWVADTLNGRVEEFDSNGGFILQIGGFGVQGFDRFDPSGIAISNNDIVCVLDQGNNQVEEFSLEGVSLLKFGSLGNDNGQFIVPLAIAIGEGGDLYVLDALGRIQRFDSMGNFKLSFVDAGNGIGTDSAGNVYVADSSGLLFKYDQNGSPIRGFSGPGPGGTFVFFEPCGIAIDRAGDIYVTNDCQIQKLGPDGSFDAAWGSSVHGHGRFSSPEGIAVDASGSVYVADTLNARVQKFSPLSGMAAPFALQFEPSAGTPVAVAVDRNSFVYVIDRPQATSGISSSDISKFDSKGKFLGKIEGQILLESLTGLATDSSNNLYVLDAQLPGVREFDSAGRPVKEWIAFGEGELGDPHGIAVDASGNIFIGDGDVGVIKKYDNDGNFLLQFGMRGSGPGGFTQVGGLALDGVGNVYAFSSSTQVPFGANLTFEPVQKFDSSGNFIGSLGPVGSGPGQFYFPRGIAVDASGNVYVSDRGQRVQVFGQAVQDPNAPPPAISSAAYNGTTLKIKGSNFGPAPRVLLNGSDVTRDVKSESVSVIKVKGDMAALGVVSGMNTVQVVNVFNVGSNTVAFSVP